MAVCKRLHFSNCDEIESTVVESERHATQSESSVGHLVDKVHADATTFSPSNDEDTVPGSQHTEMSNDTSPERNHASSVRNLRDKLEQLHNEIIPETDVDEDEEDACNTTFTQRVSQKMESDNQTLSLQRSVRSSSSDALITITTKYKPPSVERIVESMTMYGVPRCRAEKPFFSNKLDLAKHKEYSNVNALCFDVPAFKSSLEDITSIKLWRRMKVNEFYPSGANIKSCHLKRTLAGYNLMTIKPLATPPSPKDVRDWVRAKEYLRKKDHDAKSCKQTEGKALPGAHDPSIVNVNEPGTSDKSLSNTSSIERSVSLLSGTSDDDRKFEYTQNSNDSQNSGSILNPSLRKALENPLLYKQKNETEQRFSYGPIESLSKGSCGNASSENLQNARAVAAVSLIFFFSLH